jgi:hypothetical protein
MRNIMRIYVNASGLPHQLFPAELPPTGTPVWQIFGRDARIIRTHYITSYYIDHDGIVLAILTPAGPYATEMISGDSGSGIWYVDFDGKAKQLGVVNRGGMCHTGFWTREIVVSPTLTVPARIAMSEINTLNSRPVVVPPSTASWTYDFVPPVVTPTPPMDDDDVHLARIKELEAAVNELTTSRDEYRDALNKVRETLEDREKELFELQMAWKTLATLSEP